MRNASGHQGKNRRQRKNSEQDNIQHFLHKTYNWEVSGSFTLSSCETTAKKCTKKVVFFGNETIVLFFAVFVAVVAWLALHDFRFCFSNL